jgi:hypothetical protein
MITRARHTAHAIIARWQATCHSSTEQSIPIPGIIDSLEERELDWVRRCAGLEAIPKVLNGDVRVSDYLAVAGEILRCRVVCSGGVGEGAGCQAFHLYGNGESCACGDVLGGLGGRDDRRDHVGC